MLPLHQQPPEQRIINKYLAPKFIRTNRLPNALSLELLEASRSPSGALTLERSHNIQAPNNCFFLSFRIMIAIPQETPIWSLPK